MAATPKPVRKAAKAAIVREKKMISKDSAFSKPEKKKHMKEATSYFKTKWKKEGHLKGTKNK